MSRKPKTLGGIERIAQDAVDEAYSGVMELWDSAIGDTPIERLFFTAFVTLANRGIYSTCNVHRITDAVPLERAIDVAEKHNQALSTAFVTPQATVAGWRVDFLIHYRSYAGNDRGELRKLIVECDGHDFHERTKTQAQRDRSRDRTAQHAGVTIFRFTGSELWRDPMGCAAEVLSFMER